MIRFTCTTFQALLSCFSNKFLLFLLLLVEKRQVMDKAYMYFTYISSEDTVRQPSPSGDFNKHCISNGDPIKGPSVVPHCVLWNKGEWLVGEETQGTTEPVDTCQ